MFVGFGFIVLHLDLNSVTLISYNFLIFLVSGYYQMSSFDKQVSGTSDCSSTSISKGSSEIPLLSLVETIKNKHVLLLHAGGDSKRVPWANPMGKVFLPLPYLAQDDPDGSVPLLFDHILAIASSARQAFQNEGYMFCPVSCNKIL